jgi:signal transduction histidine kinase
MHTIDTITGARDHRKRMAARTTDLAKRAGGRASHVIAFIAHAIAWALVSLLITVTAGIFPGFVTALAWGVGLSIHGFFAVVAPEVRRQWEARELAASAGDERRMLEGRHQHSLEQLAASIAHEIRNPITAAKSLLQQMREDPASADNAEYARVAIDELDRVERSVSHLLRYARDEDMRLEELELGSVVTTALEGMLTRIGSSRARVERDLDFDARCRGDRDKLRRVIVNLVENALDALDASTTEDPHVRVSCGRNLAGSEVWIKVSDNGPGIEPSRLAHVFDPFHTSKASGTGLGLAITKKLVEAHGGTIEITSNASTRGTEVSLTIPSGVR